ncbi:hypothetical protein HDU98_001168 [Podochytrium sp. JEL0797]|nr:hypothetical protein HDU98_001168 [Podochytrium sp. JEL0797]
MFIATFTLAFGAILSAAVPALKRSAASPIPALGACGPFDMCADSTYVCCVAPGDLPTGKTSCRPNDLAHCAKLSSHAASGLRNAAALPLASSARCSTPFVLGHGYFKGAAVSFNGVNYVAKWWETGKLTPDQHGDGGWSLQGPCSSGAISTQTSSTQVVNTASLSTIVVPKTTATTATTTMLIPITSTQSTTATAGPGSPVPYTYVGCFESNNWLNKDSGNFNVLDPHMTLAKCAQFAYAQNYPFTTIGLENGNVCRFGYLVGTPLVQSQNCVVPCGGDASEECGGPATVSMYTIPPNGKPLHDPFLYVGCTIAYSATYLLPLTSDNMTVESCTQAAAMTRTFDASPYYYMGLANGNECLGGGSWIPPSEATGLIGDLQCTSPCTGNVNETCGGATEVSMYIFGLVNKTTGTTATSTMMASSTQLTTKTVVTSAVASHGSPIPYTYVGCFESNNWFNKTSVNLNVVDPKMTLEHCAQIAHSQNYPFTTIGLENGNVCRFGHLETPLVPSQNCVVPCGGNSSQKCGGLATVSMYTIPPNGKPLHSWASSIGCAYVDTPGDPGDLLLTSENMSLELCAQAAAMASMFTPTLFYNMGLKNGNECWGGPSFSPSGPLAPIECSTLCAGNAFEICGGAAGMSWYFFEPTWCPGPYCYTCANYRCVPGR